MVMLYTDYIHRFSHKITGIPLPVAFTFPFHYTPHKLTILAADEVQAYLRSRTDWEEELHAGKMFGVLVVRTSNGQIGYLAAFSGNLAGSNLHDFFVPPIYDLLQPDGFFRIEEANISAINMQIKKMEESMEYQSARTTLAETTSMAEQQLSKAKHALKEAKAEREKKRVQEVDETELKRMERESQFQKAEYKRMERRMKDEINVYTEKLQTIEKTIDQLKQ